MHNHNLDTHKRPHSRTYNRNPRNSTYNRPHHKVIRTKLQPITREEEAVDTHRKVEVIREDEDEDEEVDVEEDEEVKESPHRHRRKMTGDAITAITQITS